MSINGWFYPQIIHFSRIFRDKNDPYEGNIPGNPHINWWKFWDLTKSTGESIVWEYVLVVWGFLKQIEVIIWGGMNHHVPAVLVLGYHIYVSTSKKNVESAGAKTHENKLFRCIKKH